MDAHCLLVQAESVRERGQGAEANQLGVRIGRARETALALTSKTETETPVSVDGRCVVECFAARIQKLANNKSRQKVQPTWQQ